MRPIGLVGLILVLAAGCGGGGPSSPSQGSGNQVLQGLAGSWQATRAEFISAANSSVRIEVVARGTTMSLALGASGSYTHTITDPGAAATVQTGTWAASRDVLTLRPSGVTFTIEFDYTLSGNTLALAGGHVEFDVNDDGAVEEAILNSTLTRG